MSFVFYDITFLVIFSIFLIVFLLRNRKNIKREGVLILYRTKVGLKLIEYFSKRYKKSIGYAEYIFIFLGYCLMLTAVYLIFKIVYLFFRFPEIIKIIKIPPVAPLIPYLPAIFKADYLPAFYFTYWIVVLAVTAIFHEFFHGIFAKSKGVDIKSTGFAFLGPFTAFFVEPDEKKVEKLKIKNQLSFVAAGSIANLMLTVFFFLVMLVFFMGFFVPSGAIFNTYTFTIINASNITGLGNENISLKIDGFKNLTQVFIENKTYYIEGFEKPQNTKPSKKDFDEISFGNRDYSKSSIENISDLESSGLIIAYEDSPALKAGLRGVIVEFDSKKIRNNDEIRKSLETKKPGDIVKIKTIFNDSIEEYELELEERPDNETKAYLGVAFLKPESSGIIGKIREKIIFFKDPNTYYKPRIFNDFIIFVYNLIWWLVFINFSVALGNMLPVGIADGGRFFYLTILGLTKNKKIAKKAFGWMTKLILLVFAFLMLLWFFGFFR